MIWMPYTSSTPVSLLMRNAACERGKRRHKQKSSAVVLAAGSATQRASRAGALANWGRRAGWGTVASQLPVLLVGDVHLRRRPFPSWCRVLSWAVPTGADARGSPFPAGAEEVQTTAPPVMLSVRTHLVWTSPWSQAHRYRRSWARVRVVSSWITGGSEPQEPFLTMKADLNAKVKYIRWTRDLSLELEFCWCHQTKPNHPLKTDALVHHLQLLQWHSGNSRHHRRSMLTFFQKEILLSKSLGNQCFLHGTHSLPPLLFVKNSANLLHPCTKYNVHLCF